jgi:hypothetical protein
MTTPRVPEGELLDIMELDRAIEGLRLSDPQPAEPEDGALALLLDFRQEIGERSDAILDSRENDPDALLPIPTTSPRPRRRHRWAVIPAAGALVLASTGAAAALSGAPSAPLYPLHRLIFGHATTSSSAKVIDDLRAAGQLLDQAAAEPYANRAGALSQARVLLSQARLLLPLAGTQTSELSMRVSKEFARLARLEAPPGSSGILPTPAPAHSAEAPTDDGSNQPGSSLGGETESSTSTEGAGQSVEPATGESEAPETVTTSSIPVGSEPAESPPAPVATHSSWGGNDDPAGSESDVSPRSASVTDR